MTHYDKAWVCRNGHSINTAVKWDSSKNAEHCPQCGEPAVKECEACNAPLRGDRITPAHRSDWGLHVPGKRIRMRRVPAYCHACGKAYPWTERKAEAMEEMIDELDGLSDEERNRLKKSIPDIIADTPKSETAALRFKKAVAKVGEAGGNLMMKVLASVATEAVKNSMGM